MYWRAVEGRARRPNKHNKRGAHGAMQLAAGSSPKHSIAAVQHSGSAINSISPDRRCASRLQPSRLAPSPLLQALPALRPLHVASDSQISFITAAPCAPVATSSPPPPSVPPLPAGRLFAFKCTAHCLLLPGSREAVLKQLHIAGSAPARAGSRAAAAPVAAAAAAAAMSGPRGKESALDLAKFVDKSIRVKLAGGREGEGMIACVSGALAQ